MKKVLVLAVLAVFIVGCASMKGRWEETRSLNTIAAYEKFIKEYPQGKFVWDAKSHLGDLYEQKDWNESVRADSIDSYEKYLKKYQNGKFSKEAKEKIEGLRYQQARGKDSLSSYREYLKSYPAGRFSQESRSKIEELEFQEAREKNTFESFESYLKRYSSGKFSEDARLGLENLYFAQAKKENTISAYENFLKRYPQNFSASIVKGVIEELYYERAKKENNITAYNDFLKKYDQGKLASDAHVRIESLYLQQAKDTNTIEAYEKFLEKYPEGPSAIEASASLGKLKEELEDMKKSVRRALPKGTKFDVTSVSQFPQKPAFVIQAHLLEGHSADESNPYVRGDYGDHERLTRLIRLRCSKIIQSIAQSKLPDASKITIEARHGVRESYFAGGVGGTDVAMTLYEVSISLEKIKKQDWKNISAEKIMGLWEVDENIIPSLRFSFEFH